MSRPAQHLDHATRHAQLYGSIWSNDPNYGTRQSDVEDTVDHRIIPHMDRALPFSAVPRGLTVVDFGAGDGRFLRALYDRGRCIDGIGIDLHKPQSLPKWMRWHVSPLWTPTGAKGDYVISTDTLEHMPPEMVPAVMKNIANAAAHGFLRISTRQDIYGTERGLHLHETVEPPEWWLARCQEVAINPSSWRIYPGHAVEIWW